MIRPWLWLTASALLQVGWLVALRETHGFKRVLPLIAYVLFGASSTWCLSRAMLSIPLSTAYAVWTGLSVAGTLATDRALGNETLSGARLACIALIMAGTIGLHVSSQVAR
jgi:quaternary ammonium compound-resistance protein SugE